MNRDVRPGDEGRIDLIVKAVERAAVGDADGVARTLLEIGSAKSDGAQLYQVCLGTEAVALHVLPKRFGRDGGVWTFDARDLDLDDAASLFALRFIAAFANDDYDTCEALYEVAGQAGEGDFTASVIALIMHTGLYVRGSALGGTAA